MIYFNRWQPWSESEYYIKFVLDRKTCTTNAVMATKEKSAWQWLHRGNAVARSLLSKTNILVPNFTSFFGRFHQVGKASFDSLCQSTASALSASFPHQAKAAQGFPWCSLSRRRGHSLASWQRRTTTHHFCGTSHFSVSVKLLIYTSSESALLFYVLKLDFLLPWYVTILSALLGCFRSVGLFLPWIPWSHTSFCKQKTQCQKRRHKLHAVQSSYYQQII